MRIGELAARADVSVRSLRYYEEQGLLSSIRSPSGQRTYVEPDVERVRFLQQLYSAGLSSRTIAELLPCVESPGAEQTDDAWERLVEERQRLDNFISDLLQTRGRLDDVIKANRRDRSRYSADAVDAAGPARSSLPRSKADNSV